MVLMSCAEWHFSVETTETAGTALRASVSPWEWRGGDEGEWVGPGAGMTLTKADRKHHGAAQEGVVMTP